METLTEIIEKEKEYETGYWIKIKGLNSFLEPQEIDFQELTGEGLFGIFGPTGSGKSSILDGITLALYGTTARKQRKFYPCEYR